MNVQKKKKKKNVSKSNPLNGLSSIISESEIEGGFSEKKKKKKKKKNEKEKKKINQNIQKKKN